MADYYSLLARAVANLPKSSPPSTRRAIYDRARKALTNQLRSLKPQLPESDIAREERALDEAVAKLEAEFEPALAAEVHTLPLAPAPLQPPPDPPAAPPPTDFAAEADGELAEPEPPPPPPPPRPEPVFPRAPAPPVRPMAPNVAIKPPTPRPTPAPPPPPPPAPAPPPPAPPPPPPSGGLPNAAAFKAPLLGGVEPAEEAPASALGPVVRAYAEESPAPALGPGAAERTEPARPVLNDAGRRKTPTWLWVGGAIAVGFAASVAALALLMRPALRDLSEPAPIDTPAAAAGAPEKAKIRIGSPAPTPAETPSPAPTAEASAPAPSPTATPEPAPTQTLAVNPAPAPAQTLPIASRAAMLVATVADAAKPQVSVGNAVWTLIPAPAGQPQSAIGVKSEIDIPDLKMHASMILRKNFDTSLPASHTIDLRVSFDAGSAVKGIKDIALPLMRRDDPPAADALTGVRVKISDNYFLVGLNRGEAEIQRNVQEIAERSWFDFPMQLDDDRIAKLTFEKGADGEKIVAQALAAWK